jgi:hypothetical protein
MAGAGHRRAIQRGSGVTPTHETNGRIKLTWQQFVWGVTVLVMLVGMWTRMEMNNALILVTLGTKADTTEVRHIDRDFREFMRVVQSAQAAGRR